MNSKEFSRSLNRPDPPTQIQALRSMSGSIHTLFRAPLHERFHQEMSEATKSSIQQLQPPIPVILKNISEKSSHLVDPEKQRLLPKNELITLAGVLVQFTDYVPGLQPYASTSFDVIENVYDGIVGQSKDREHPLSFSEQLDIVLKQNSGDLPESLWNLFFTSRFLGRWLDGQSIRDLPPLNHNEIIDKMITWQQSVLACKDNQEGAQDVVGDTYYTWTHAIAQVVFDALPQNKTLSTAITADIFKRGTKLMHTLVHRINPQAVVNRHDIAEQYGNSIGKTCVDILENRHPSKQVTLYRTK